MSSIAGWIEAQWNKGQVVAVAVRAVDMPGANLERVDFDRAKKTPTPSIVSVTDTLERAIDMDLGRRHGETGYLLLAIGENGSDYGTVPITRQGRNQASLVTRTPLQLDEHLYSHVGKLVEHVGLAQTMQRSEWTVICDHYKEQYRIVVTRCEKLEADVQHLRGHTNSLFEDNLLVRARVAGHKALTSKGDDLEEEQAPKVGAVQSLDQLRAKLEMIATTVGPTVAFLGPGIQNVLEALTERLKLTPEQKAPKAKAKVDGTSPPKGGPPKAAAEVERLVASLSENPTSPKVQDLIDILAELSHVDVARMWGVVLCMRDGPAIVQAVLECLTQSKATAILVALEAMLTPEKPTDKPKEEPCAPTSAGETPS